jgi:hypothetical protein
MDTIKTVELPEGVTTKTIKIARTRTGVPCLWESATDFSDLRRATVVYNADSSHKKALYMKKNSEKQALVPISAGDYISKAFEDKNGYALSVFCIHEISSMKNEAVIYPVFRRSSFETDRTWEGTQYESMVDETIIKLQVEEAPVYAQFEMAE